MSHGLKSLKGGYIGDYIGNYYRGNKGHTRSVDYSSNVLPELNPINPKTRRSSTFETYSPPYVDRIWGIWGSYYNVPRAIFYLLKGDP